MRPGSNPELTAALEAAGIRTAILAWFDFESGPIGCWTGGYPIQVSDADAVLNGKTFEPLQNGVLINVGGNQFSLDGSEALTLSMTLTDLPPDFMIYASLDPSEYQARTCILWRAIMVTPPSANAAAVWAFRRVRAGSMDELRITNSGSEHIFTLTVEGHASMITKASGSTYLDQPKIDPSDTSQRYAVSIANNPRAPGRNASGSIGGGGSSVGGGGGGDGNGWNGGGGWLALR